MNVGVNNKATAINQIFIGVNNIAKLVYQGGGGGGSDFQLPTYTGSNSIFGDTTSGRIELYESGTIVLFPGKYDMFLVGGGASGGAESSHTQSESATGGGGSGYTTTQKSITISERTEANVTVGAGGVFTYAKPYKSVAGGTTSIQSSSFSNNAQGGKSTNSDTSGTDSAGEGTDGGSGGGARATAGNEAGHIGGSNGSNGESNNIMGIITAGGVGQGSTTRAFGEDDGTLYAGGGGGGNITSSSRATGSSAGGAGGGGNGGTYNSPDGGTVYNVSTAGTANTGGGGGGGAINSAPANVRPQNGGSGIVIIRWNNAGGGYDPVLANNTWAQIGEAVATNDPVLDSWNVGDEKDAVIDGETLTFVIVGKNHDDLADGSGKAKLSFTTKNLLRLRKRMSADTTGHETNFFNCELYTSYLSDIAYNGMESELKNAVKAVRKPCLAGPNDKSATTQECYIWLPSKWEVFGNITAAGASSVQTGEKYEYFVTNTERIKRMSNGTGAAEQWWTRDRSTGAVGCYVTVESNGELSWSPQNDSMGTGVCFGFCI